MSQIHTDYNAYLLRVWIERDANTPGNTSTHLSLQDVAQGKRTSFQSIADLIKFLEEQAQSAIKQIDPENRENSQ